MSNATELKTKFTNLLKSMFQLDQPELDFGLYRIMHAKADRINRFLDTELANQIDVVFVDADQTGQNQAIEAAKQTLIKQLGEGAFDEKGELVEHFKAVPAAKDYLSAVVQAKSGKGNLSERAVIYDHLIRFFSRYYDGGDFMSRRYHVAENKSRAAAYAVPYDGSEVYLHWANKDQYYIKTTESFNLYSFDIGEAAKLHAEQAGKNAQPGLLDWQDASQLANKRIHFKLVDAEQGEHNNNKESEKRQFFIRAEQPLALSETGELEVYFEFRVATKNDTISAEQEKQLKARFGKEANKGDLPNLYITQVIQDALLAMQEEPRMTDFVKFVQILAPTDKIKQRPLLTKYINNYTSKNTMDYFIHKDLGGFLQRELDFYIKNEIMRLDDIEQADEGNYARLLKQIKTLRGVAKEIIAFLAQLEDFQKKLWLKKKFVTETQYCITLDRLEAIDESEAIDDRDLKRIKESNNTRKKLINATLENQAQRQEWVKLFALDLNELDQVKAQGNEAVLANEKFKYLVLDTQFFNAAFKDELLAEIEDLDEQSNGLLINSDNFQALQLLKEKYCNTVKSIYIDPPYNTSASEIMYKNSYKHSSWLSLIDNTIGSAKALMSKSEGVMCCTIDDAEQKVLSQLIEHHYGEIAGTVAIRIKPSGRPIPNGFALSHEYAIFSKSNNNYPIQRLAHSEEHIARYRETDEKGRFFWEMFRKAGSNSNRSDRPTMYYPFFLNQKTMDLRLPKMTFDESTGDYIWQDELNLNEIAVYPIKDDGGEGCWYFGYDRALTVENEFQAREQDDGNYRIYYRRRPNEGMQPTTNWFDAKYSATEHGTALLKKIFGKQEVFSYPKSIHAVSDCLSVSGVDNNRSSITLDYFAGSATTGHAVINFNRIDNGSRKYLLCEMGVYFYEVTKPRIQKVVYAKDWKDGKPVFDKDGQAGGVSQCFKYLRLEQYEDTLNNLVDSRTYDTSVMPKDFTLSYLLEAETAESPSLLNLQQFNQPRHYQLNIKRPNSDQSTPQVIDLVETFNWLIGLNVVKLDKWRAYDCEFAREHDPELPQDQHTRLKVTRIKQADAYADDVPVYQMRTVEGWVRRIPGNDELRDRVLVIWRNLSDDPEKDSAFLEAMLDKLKINQADSQFDKIYINGPHGLQLHGSAKTRLLSLEDTFMTKMWEGA